MSDQLLIIGFNPDKLYHIQYALDQNIPLHLLIRREKYKEYKETAERYFETITVVDSLRDAAEVEAAVQPLRGVVTSVLTRFETYLSTAGYVNDVLDLDGFSYQTARKFGNKYKMKKAWLENNVPCADGASGTDEKELEAFLDRTTFPVMVKAASGRHAMYVFKANNREQVYSCIQKVLDGDVSGAAPLSSEQEPTVVVEEFLSGIEVSIDSYVTDESITHTPISEYMRPEEFDLDDSYLPVAFCPTALSQELQNRVMQVTAQAIKAQGAKRCICHSELFVRPETGEIFMVEATARGGGYRSPMINAITDGNFDASVIRATLGQSVESFSMNGKGSGFVEYFAEKKGTVSDIDVSFLDEDERIIDYTQRYEKGAEVKPGQVGGKYIVSLTYETSEASQAREVGASLFRKLQAAVIVD